MASEEVGVKIVRIVYDASKARDGAKEARRSLKEIEDQAVQTGNVIGRMEGTLNTFGAGFSRVARLAGVFGVALSLAGAVGFAKEITQAVGGLGSMAEQLTTNTRYLQAMQYAATGASVKLEDLEKGAGSFALKIGQAAQGNKDAIDSFKRIGVMILDAQGNVRPFNDLLTEAARKLEAVDNANVKAALSTELFDKAGRKMLTLVPALAKGQGELATAAQKAGAMISPEKIKQWDDLGSSAEQSFLKWRAFAGENLFEPVALGFKVIGGAIALTLAPLKALILGIDWIKGAGDWLGKTFTTGPSTGTGAVETLERIEFEQNNIKGQPGAAPLLKKLDGDAARVKGTGGQGWHGADPFWLIPDSPPTTGASHPGVRGAGDGDSDRIEKLRNTLRQAAEAQDVMTAAALRGSVAFQEQDIKAKSLEQAMQAYGDKLDRNNPKVRALAAEIEGFNRRVIEGKAAESFAVATTELEKQNVLLAAELKLVNELPEVRARELAIIRAKQEAEKGGQAITVEAIEARQKAIEQNETLKTQQEDLKRAQELWTEPLKRALGDIQSRAADMWEGILTNGKFSMQEFGQLFAQTARRAAAELLALATIRPVIGMAVEGMSSVGLVSPGTARQLGYGTGGGIGGGGLGMPSMGGPGGGSGLFGAGDFLSRPIGSLFASSTPAGGFADVGALLQSGQTGASAAASGIGGLGGISIGQGLGALGGFGMGAYNLINSKSTGQTIGGIGSMVGAAVSLIPGIGQIAGPIISIASALLPSLIGEADTRTHNSTNASLRYGAGGYGTSGGAWGPGANVSQSQAALGSLGGNIGAVYDLLGGVKDSSKVWGMDLSSWTASGKDWSYTSRATHLVDPSGNRSAWRMNEDNMVDTASAQVAMRSILSGAVGEITANMRTAVTAMLPATTTLQDVAKGVVFVTDTYEKLGKTVVSIEPEFDALEKTFKDMASTATSLGLSLEPVTAEQKKQTERLGQDFIDNLVDPVAAALRAFADEKATILANVDYIDRHTDVVVDMARINEALLRKEAALKEQLTGGTVQQLEDAIKRLTYGDLANITGAGTLAGMQASFNATVAQARAGDMSAYQRVAGEGLALTDASRGYYASSPEYEADRREILAIFSELQAQLVGGSAASPSATAAANANTATALNNMQELQAMFRDVTERLAASDARNAELVDLMKRLLSRAA